ncbi:MAG: hypothetical protein ACOX4N_00270 [Dethiobacteraceae bacterium]|jgi:hypothetical protein
MKKFMLALLKDEQGQSELSSQVLILVGVITIAGILLTIFRDQLRSVLTERFTRFRNEW